MSFRSGVSSALILALTSGLLLTGMFPPHTQAPAKLAAGVAAGWCFIQLVRWTLLRRLSEIHDHFVGDHFVDPAQTVDQAHVSDSLLSKGVAAQRPVATGDTGASTGGILSLRSPLARMTSRLSEGAHGDVRQFGSTHDAALKGWVFFDAFANFGGISVARYAVQCGNWHEYDGLAEPEPDGVQRVPPPGTIRFGKLLYRRMPAPPPEAQEPASVGLI